MTKATNCAAHISAKEFNLIDREAQLFAQGSGRKVALNVDYIKAAEKLLGAYQQQFTELNTRIAASRKTSEDTYDTVPREHNLPEEDKLIEAVESAKTDEDLSSAMDALVRTYLDSPHDTPKLDNYLDENAKNKAFNRAWNEAEQRYNAELEKPGENGIGMGRSEKGSAGTIDKVTAAEIAKALTRARFRQGEQKSGFGVPFVESTVAAILKRMKSPPQVLVEANASRYLPVGSVDLPKGVTLPDGRIVAFANAAESSADIALTVFHELLHRGVKVHFANNATYVKTMLDLAASDSLVQQYANDWKASADGRQSAEEFAQNGKMTGDRLSNYEALAVEEALARMAEDVKSGVMYDKKSTLQKIVHMLAEVADTLGLTQVGAILRNSTGNETEQFVRELLAKSGGDAKQGNTALMFRSEKDLSAAETASKTPTEWANKYKRTQLGYLIRSIAAGWRGRPELLGFLTLDQIKDRFGNEFKNVSNTVDKWLFMGQRANQLMNMPAKLSEQWGMLTRKHPSETIKLNKLFVDSTTEGVWIDQPAGQDPASDPRNKHVDFKNPETAKAVREMRNEFLRLPEAHRKLYTDVVTALGTQFRAKQEAILKHVVDMFKGDLEGVMPPQEMLEFAQQDKLDRMVTKADLRQGITNAQRVTLQKFNAAVDSTYIPTNALPGPYFPLQRKGDHIVVQKSQDYKVLESALDDARAELNDALNREVPEDEAGQDSLKTEIDSLRQKVRIARDKRDAAKADRGKYHVAFFNSLPEAEDFAADARRDNPNMNVSLVRRQEYQNNMDGVPSTFLAKITDKLAKELPKETAADVSAAVRDLIVQSLPDRSALKSELRRMNVAGVKPEDALDSFKQASNRNAWTISRLENVSELTQALTAAHGSEDMNERVVGNELAKRYAKSLEYTPRNALLDAASNLSYINHLGFSVGYYFQNMLQPWTVSAPILAGRHGINATGKALASATADTIKAMRNTIKAKDAFNLDMRLNLDSFSADEKKLLQQLTDEGRLDITVRADLGVGGSEQGGIKHVAQRAAEISSWPAHQVEIVNRVATALAAFRMEKARGSSFSEAMKYADKIVAQTHVDYSVENAPRFMNPNAMGGLGRLTFQFKRYQQAMVFLWGKTLSDGIKEGGWNEHTKALTYLTGVNFALAGVNGLPLAAPIGLLVWAISKALGDDDQRDWAEMFWAGVKDSIGETGERLIHKGVSASMGVDMSASLGQGRILSPIYRLPNAKTGQDWAGAMALQLFGATGGTISNMADALMLYKDNPEKAIGRLMPKGIAGFVEAVDRENRGLTDRKGNVVIGKDELAPVDFIAKGLSLGESSKVSDMYDTRSAINNETQARQETRARLLREASRARQDGDTDAAAAVREQIDAFNEKNPAVRILPKDVIAYWQGDVTRQKEMVGGIRVNKRNADIAEQYGVTR